MQGSRRTWGWIVVAWALLLAGCGGGGSGASSPDPVTPPTDTGLSDTGCSAGQAAKVVFTSQPVAGRNVEMSLLPCGAAAVQPVRWTQTSGSAVTMLSDRSSAITVEPPAAEVFRFNVDFTDDQGKLQGVGVQFSPAPATTAPLVLRGEPSIWSGGQGSLRAWSPQGSLTSVHWHQLSGPTASLSTPDAAGLIYHAPTVTADTVLRLQADATLSDGRQISGVFNLLVQLPGALPADPLFAADNPASRVVPFLAQGPHAQALSDCIYSPQLSRSSPNNLCTLGRLPLLGTATQGEVPTVEQIMQRVLVSNDWMGTVFERFLREQDPFGDYKRLLASATAVVIGGRVRPAFYWNATGAIYIDASYLWLTPEQRDTLSEAPDPRSNNGDLLAFATPWRYVLGDTHASDSYLPDARQSRSLLDIRYELGRLLYHELTHAADFLPPSVHTSLDPNLRVYQASPAVTASQSLHEQLPFFSTVLQGLARVLSYGDTPDAAQRSLQPADIASLFAADRVNDDYSYSVPTGAAFSREDAAMLVEETMMQLRYGVMRDVAVTPPIGTTTTSANLVVTWGQRGRIGEAAIRPRVKLVLAQTMPWINPIEVDGLKAPVAMRAGQTWGDNLKLGTSTGGRPQALSAQEHYNELQQTTRALLNRGSER
jgi:hypothetical protein